MDDTSRIAISANSIVIDGNGGYLPMELAALVLIVAIVYFFKMKP